MATENPQILEAHPLDSGRAEIDTSAPFESVKEAANRFGGMGFWKPSSLKPSEHVSEHEIEVVVDVVNLEEQTAQLERDLIVKERETLDVLKELETTKNIVEELKLKLQKEASDISAALKAESTSDSKNQAAAKEPEEEGKHEKDGIGGVDLCPSEAPGFILLELKQAKLNLTKTTTDLADIRATVDAYNKRIERERASLERTRQRLSSNTSRISCLEEELNQKRQKLEEVKDGEVSRDPINITRELQKLSSETEKFKKVGEDARTQVQRALSEIEQTKARIRTAEIRLVAAKKMKEAARASEAVAFAEMKALSKSSAPQQNSEDVTLTFEEYSSLIAKAREADEVCKGRVADTMLLVDEAHVSKTQILKKVEEATEEVKVSKKALEEALSRVETANQGKLAVEEALRVWRSEHGHKRRSVHNCTKFKNPSLQRKDSRLLDVNGVSLVSNELKPVLKPTLSIGQILSRKLLLTEDYENGIRAGNKIVEKRKISLGQMLSKPSSDPQSARKSGKENKEVAGKRKKFGFARISLLVAKQSKKKKTNVAANSLRGGRA